ncbi:MAG TPA: efflux RND transporter periplasmic adaptor subunit [Ferruginibacter sp.]|nr:efflux RND transporter periplasmic adaptor subunit [Ferruginibacter sp.]HRQ20134.1 efflux RND transporter periplasmic adaptor subunit [Ferruginibacter sp.]
MKRLNFYIVFLFALHVVIGTASCNNKEKTDHTAHDQEKDVYTCPMHPEIIRNAPGSCPICGMDLVKKETGSEAIKDVQLEALLKPVDGFVISTVQVTSVEQRDEDIELDVVGTVAYDTRQAGAISSRVNGRIEKLYVRYKYQPVQKGQRIMDIYSPELMTAQQNLLFLLRNDPNNISLIDAAKDRLRLMGMSAGQIATVVRTGAAIYSVPVFSNYSGFVTDINTATNAASADNMQPAPTTNQELTIKEGMYVQNGQAVFTVYNQSKAWILLDIYPEQQTLVQVGNPVRIVPETAPSENFRATVDYIEPVFRTGKKTVAARVYFNNATRRLPIGSRVTANIFAKPKAAWWLPKEAILSLGREKVVFKKEATGFRAIKITTGIEVNRQVQILTGLQKQDSVAVNAQYLVDNEAFIKANNNE